LLGRETDLIIRGGQNIYPIDIEAALTQHPHVREVSVAGIPEPEMGERVWAFVVCHPNRSLTLAEIRIFLEEKGLARFKWPEGLTLLESLPKVAAGHKIDREKLKQMAQG
jgi:acyl-CoA synthetase (AMP-forming)/AMP-acid ligase II